MFQLVREVGTLCKLQYFIYFYDWYFPNFFHFCLKNVVSSFSIPTWRFSNHFIFKHNIIVPSAAIFWLTVIWKSIWRLLSEIYFELFNLMMHIAALMKMSWLAISSMRMTNWTTTDATLVRKGSISWRTWLSMRRPWPRSPTISTCSEEITGQFFITDIDCEWVSEKRAKENRWCPSIFSLFSLTSLTPIAIQMSWSILLFRRTHKYCCSSSSQGGQPTQIPRCRTSFHLSTLSPRRSATAQQHLWLLLRSVRMARWVTSVQQQIRMYVNAIMFCFLVFRRSTDYLQNNLALYSLRFSCNFVSMQIIISWFGICMYTNVVYVHR